MRRVDRQIAAPLLLFGFLRAFGLANGVVWMVDLIRNGEVVGVTGVNESHKWAGGSGIAAWKWVFMVMFLSYYELTQGLLFLGWVFLVLVDPLNLSGVALYHERCLVHQRYHETLRLVLADYIVHFAHAVIFLSFHACSYVNLQDDVYKDSIDIRRDTRRPYQMVAVITFGLSLIYETGFLAASLRSRHRVRKYIKQLKMPGPSVLARRDVRNGSEGPEESIDFEMEPPRQNWPFALNHRGYTHLRQGTGASTIFHHRLGGQITCSDCMELEIYLRACIQLICSHPVTSIQHQFCLKDSFLDLSVSAARGCNSCQIWRVALLNECFSAEDIAKVNDSGPGSRTPVLLGGFKCIGRYPQFDHAWTFEVSITCQVVAAVLLYDRYGSDVPAYNFRRPIQHALQEASLGLEHYTTQDSTIERDVTSSRIIDRVKDWLSECCQQHSKCGGDEHENMSGPRRLLDVQNSAVKLVDKSQVKPEATWMALSYCWGSDQVVKLTRDSLPQHRIGIDESSLPGTIQDAINVARALEIWYLWIDVLCIIQDDGGDDWNMHAGIMHHIYGGAKLTLCACSAMSAVEGFRLGDGPLHEGRRIAQRYRFGTRRKSGLADLLPIIASYALPVVRSRSPSNKRGWIFQEEILSTRTLYWSHHGVYWSCGTTILGENNTKSELTVTTTGPPEHEAAQTHRDILDLHGFRLASRETDWDRMVEAYSTRRFTRMTDRLPALKGLASVYKDSQGGQYLENAGIWKNRFPQQLLWVVAKRSPAAIPQPVGRRKFDLEAGPSWTWTSVRPEYGVQFHDDRSTELTILDINEEQSQTTLSLRGRLRQLLAGLHEAENPQGPSSGRPSPALEGRWTTNTTLYSLTIHRDSRNPIAVDLDENLDNDQRGSLFALEVNATRFLVLSWDPGEGAYRRIGCSQKHRDLHYFDDTVFTDVVLV